MTAQTLAEPTESGGTMPRGRMVLTLALMALALFACRDAWLDILRIVQKDEEASHILLVPIVFARILWVRRGELKEWVPKASLWGVGITLIGIGLWLFGNIRAMQVVWHFGAVLALFGAFVSMNGLDIVRRLWPAFLVLVFLMPLPGVIRHPLALFLQNASAKLTEIVIVAIGFELTRYGNLLVINDYTVGVAEACNGMRMVSMLILIVFAFVFSERVRPWVRVLLIASAVPIAILCNILRLVPTVLAYGYFSPELADQLHDWLGWILAFASYFGLMGVLWLMRWLLLPVDPVGRGRRWFAVKRPNRHRDERQRRPMNRGVVMAVASLGVAAVLGGSIAIGASLPDGSEAAAYHERVLAVSQDLPREIGAWSSVDTELPEAAVALLKPNVLISRTYHNEATDQSFALLVVQCADARDMEGHYPPNCYPSAGWTTLGEQPIRIAVGEDEVDSMDYRFERSTNSALERIGVINLILMPGGGYVTSMSSIRQLAGTVSDRYYGAAQVQFVFSGAWDLEQRQNVVEEVVQTFEPLLGVILDKSGKPEAVAWESK